MRLLLVASFISYCLVEAQNNANDVNSLNDILKPDVILTGPGVRSRLTQVGTSYVSGIVAKALTAEVPVVSFPHDTREIRLPSLPSVLLSQLHLRLFETPQNFQVNLLPPHSLSVQIPNINLSVTAVGKGNVDAVQVDGPLEIRTSRFSLQVDIKIGRNEQGNPHLKLEKCNILHKIPVTLAVQKALTPESGAKLADAISKDGQAIFEKMVCPRLAFIIDTRINQRFGLLSTKITLGNTKDFDLVRSLIAADDAQSRKTRQDSILSNTLPLDVPPQAPVLQNQAAHHSAPGPVVNQQPHPAPAPAPRPVAQQHPVSPVQHQPFHPQPAPVHHQAPQPHPAQMAQPHPAMQPRPVMQPQQFHRQFVPQQFHQQQQQVHPAPFNQGNMMAPRRPMMMRVMSPAERMARFEQMKRSAAQQVLMVRSPRSAGFNRRVERQADKFHSFLNSFNLSRADDLILDYGLVAAPIITPLGIEIATSGEISSKAFTTPFGPRALVLPNAPSASMLQIVVADYVPNTLMYHGHKTGLFNTRVDPNTAQFGSVMRTTCDIGTGSLFCVGDLFPTLREMVPNKGVAFLFSTLKAPSITVAPESQGGIKFQLEGLIEMRAIEQTAEIPIGKMEIHLDATMKMKLSSKTVRGRVQLDNIRLVTRTPTVLVQEELDDAGFLSREILQRMVNDILKQGIPIPVHPLFKLQKPKLTLMSRSMLLETNFQLNQNLIHQLTSEKLIAG